MDEPDWVSKRLTEAGELLAGASRPFRLADGLMFALADRAKMYEQHEIDPLREANWGMVFANATIFAAAVVEESKNG